MEESLKKNSMESTDSVAAVAATTIMRNMSMRTCT